MKTIVHDWGTETIVGEHDRVVRIYASSKKVTVDLSQVRDTEWSAYKAAVNKYGASTKITLKPEADVKIIAEWFERWLSA